MGVEQRAQGDGSRDRKAGKGTKRELGGRKKTKTSIKSLKSKENTEENMREVGKEILHVF